MTLMRLSTLVTTVIILGSHAATAAPQSPGNQSVLQQTATEKARAGTQTNPPSPDLIMVDQYSSELLAKAAQLGFIGSVVTGAPYSARGLTESSAVLADGTRISHSVAYAIYRDSGGRLRREDAQGVWISDPIAQVTYLLDPATHVARQLPLAKLIAGAKMKAAGQGGGPPVAAAAAPGVTDLGRQIVEGIAADGSRSSSVIPVGAVGNDRPIEVISERWLSPDLQMVVMSRMHDPRNGDTTFHLTDIRRNEPDRALFVVPAGYRIELGK